MSDGQIDLPDWMKTMVSTMNCPRCEAIMKVENVVRYGIQRSADNPKRTAEFFDYACPSCKHTSNIETKPRTLEQFVNDLIDEWTVPADGQKKPAAPAKPKEAAKKPPAPSKITDAEIAEAKRILSQTEFHADFMEQIGMSREEFAKYAKPDPEDEGKGNDGKGK